MSEFTITTSEYGNIKHTLKISTNRYEHLTAINPSERFKYLKYFTKKSLETYFNSLMLGLKETSDNPENNNKIRLIEEGLKETIEFYKDKSYDKIIAATIVDFFNISTYSKFKITLGDDFEKHYENIKLSRSDYYILDKLAQIKNTDISHFVPEIIDFDLKNLDKYTQTKYPKIIIDSN